MKNIIAIVSTVFIISLMVYTFSNGRAFQGGEAGNIIEDMKYIDTPKTVETVETKEQKNEDEEKLKALRDKAGNSGTFEVSNAYKSKCASCHGVDGSGEQNGKKLMGPKLIGQEEAVLYKYVFYFKAVEKKFLL